MTNIVKIIGALFILYSSTTIGFSYASRLERRKIVLKAFKSSIQTIEGEISFTQNPILQVFKNILNTSNDYVKAFFEKVYKELEIGNKSLKDVWGDCLDKYGAKMGLYKTDVSILEEFSLRLGKTDVENELKNIHNTILSLDIQIAEAEENCNKNKKMFQSAGVLCGMLIVVLLF